MIDILIFDYNNWVLEWIEKVYELMIDEFIDDIDSQQIFLHIKHHFEVKYYFYLKWISRCSIEMKICYYWDLKRVISILTQQLSA